MNSTTFFCMIVIAVVLIIALRGPGCTESFKSLGPKSAPTECLDNIKILSGLPKVPSFRPSKCMKSIDYNGLGCLGCSISNSRNSGLCGKWDTTLPNYVATSKLRYGNPYPPYNSPWAADSPCGKGCNAALGGECKLMQDISEPDGPWGYKAEWKCVSKDIGLPFEDCNECDHFSNVLSYYTVDRQRPPKQGEVSKFWS